MPLELHGLGVAMALLANYSNQDSHTSTPASIPEEVGKVAGSSFAAAVDAATSWWFGEALVAPAKPLTVGTAEVGEEVALEEAMVSGADRGYQQQHWQT